MEKIKIEGFILKEKNNWRGNGDYYTFHNTEMLDSYLTVCPHTIEFDVPKSFDPVSAEIDGLVKQKNAFMASIEAINDRISNLQCLEFNPTEPAVEAVVLDEEIPF